MHYKGAVKSKNSEMVKHIFIVGHIHSGTTLLQQIIGRNPSVFISGGETRYFSNLETIRKRYTNLDDDHVLRGYLTYLLRVINTGYARVNFKKNAEYQEVDLDEFNLGEDDIDALFELACE
jgi:hypothetical protein